MLVRERWGAKGGRPAAGRDSRLASKRKDAVFRDCGGGPIPDHISVWALRVRKLSDRGLSGEELCSGRCARAVQRRRTRSRGVS